MNAKMCFVLHEALAETGVHKGDDRAQMHGIGPFRLVGRLGCGCLAHAARRGRSSGQQQAERQGHRE
jgi:hypothetical protein